MEAVQILFDHRINAHNVMFSFTIGEYLDAVRGVLHNNDLQRKRITGSKSIYGLLREDIFRGCVIPPIVLALGNVDLPNSSAMNAELARDLVKENSNNLLILDGLQRTYTLLDLDRELNEDDQLRFRNQLIRVEVYIGINRLGILYRMLTLNTGQTPMSLRQQIEMLYSDYLSSGVQDLTFVREVDEAYATGLNEYNFKDIIEGFNSYLERNELPLDRSDLLENIRGLQNLSQENESKDIFKEFALAWSAFISAVHQICGHEQLALEDLENGKAAAGRTAVQAFKKSQGITGFGAAAGRLKDLEKLGNLSDISDQAEKLHLGDTSAKEYLVLLNKAFDFINLNTKKIGSAQRMYYFFYFRDLFNPESETYLNLTDSVHSALHKLKSQLF